MVRSTLIAAERKINDNQGTPASAHHSLPMQQHHIESYADRTRKTVQHHTDRVADNRMSQCASSSSAIREVYAVKQTIFSAPLRVRISGTVIRAFWTCFDTRSILRAYSHLARDLKSRLHFIVPVEVSLHLRAPRFRNFASHNVNKLSQGQRTARSAPMAAWHFC